MRSPSDIFAELEDARAFREGEIRLLQNLSEVEGEEPRQAALRRSLFLITYAHLEGFARFAMQAYASAVNSAHVPCSEAIAPLVAATLHDVLSALRHPQSKHPAFSTQLPDDSALHLAWREQQFVEKIGPLMTAVVAIPDHAIDLESNLKPAVLKRNLYRLGLEFDVVDAHSGNISMLLGRRNQIAHGEMIVPSKADVETYVTTAFEIMKFIQGEVYRSLSGQTYKRPAA